MQRARGMSDEAIRRALGLSRAQVADAGLLAREENRDDDAGSVDTVEVNGEGIYGSRPWYMYGEGKTEMPHKTIESPMTYKDIRYTTKDGYLYAFILDWPVRRGAIEPVVMISVWNQKSRSGGAPSSTSGT